MTMNQMLSQVQVGETVIIREIQDADIAIQALRLGLTPGERVVCLARIPAGPTVIKHGGMELAIGRELCQQIEVQRS